MRKRVGMKLEKRKVQGPTIRDRANGNTSRVATNLLEGRGVAGWRDCDWACMSLAEPQTHYDMVATRTGQTLYREDEAPSACRRSFYNCAYCTLRVIMRDWKKAMVWKATRWEGAMEEQVPLPGACGASSPD
jgi:hypothetical protein